MMTRLFIVLVTCIACGHGKPHEEVNGQPSAVETLRERHATWLQELRGASAEDSGWPSVSDCDGTLWAGLAKAAGASVVLELAEYEPGVIHRRPTPCWTPTSGDVGSKSTVSRDMMTGYLWGWWSQGAGGLPALERLADYGAANGWVMGLPKDRPFDVELGDNLKGVLCRAIQGLRGQADIRRECGSAPSVYLPVAADYARHVQVLGILLQGETDHLLHSGDALPADPGRHEEEPPLELTAIDDGMLKRLHENAEAEPADALFQGALGIYTGDYAEGVRLLGDDAYQCPSYVRGAPAYCLVHKAFAAWVILKHHGSL